jgi:hypothetical protein
MSSDPRGPPRQRRLDQPTGEGDGADRVERDRVDGTLLGYVAMRQSALGAPVVRRWEKTTAAANAAVFFL